RLLGVELVRGPFLMGRLAPLRGDLTLALRVHSRKTTPAALALVAGVCHDTHPSSGVDRGCTLRWLSRSAPPQGRKCARAGESDRGPSTMPPAAEPQESRDFGARARRGGCLEGR